MNKKQAETEARRRWGKIAIIKFNPLGKSRLAQREEIRIFRERKAAGENPKREFSDFRYSVGRSMLGGMFFEVLGQGDSWDEAFAAVDERDRKFREEVKRLRGES